MSLRRKWQAMQDSDQSRSSRHLARAVDGRALNTAWHDTPLTFEGELIGIASIVEPVEAAVSSKARTDESSGTRAAGQLAY